MSSVKEFLLPDLGEGLDEATIVAWLVDEGQSIELNQPLCTVETAKAEVDIPSPYAGRVVERRGAPGETLEVGSVLVRVDVGGEAAGEGAEEKTAVLVGYGTDDSTGTSRRRRAGRPPAAAPAKGAAATPLAKPPVRKLARDLGVELADLAPGSGPEGRITREDVAAAADRRRVPMPEPAAAVVRSSSVAVQAGDVIPVTGVRARIAERMTTSRATIPDAGCGVWVDFGKLLALRASLRASAEREGRELPLTPFSLVLRLVVAAVKAHPIVNATFDADRREIRVHEAIHLGVAADTPRGLVVPVVRDAHRLSTAELAHEVRRLARGAREGTLTPAELTGSTITVSNYGAFGLDEGSPVINHPEAAILGIGAIRERPVAVDGDLVVRPTAKVTCAFDHRVCDGGDVGRFLHRVQQFIEHPEALLVDV